MTPQNRAFSRALKMKSEMPRYSPALKGPWIQITGAQRELKKNNKFNLPICVGFNNMVGEKETE